jgi:hypothetical protein
MHLKLVITVAFALAATGTMAQEKSSPWRFAVGAKSYFGTASVSTWNEVADAPGQVTSSTDQNIYSANVGVDYQNWRLALVKTKGKTVRDDADYETGRGDDNEISVTYRALPGLALGLGYKSTTETFSSLDSTSGAKLFTDTRDLTGMNLQAQASSVVHQFGDGSYMALSGAIAYGLGMKTRLTSTLAPGVSVDASTNFWSSDAALQYVTALGKDASRVRYAFSFGIRAQSFVATLSGADINKFGATANPSSEGQVNSSYTLPYVGMNVIF